MDPQEQFINLLSQSLAEEKFVKLTLGKPHRSEELRNIYIRPVLIRNKAMLAFTYRYPTRDEVKNYNAETAIDQITTYLADSFFSADLFTLDADVRLLYSKKRRGRLFTQAASHRELPAQDHDRQKKRHLQAQGQMYLHAMGITDQDGKVLKTGQKKYRQINKYIEIIGSLLKQQQLPEHAHIVDMGSGKGYLTFALFDYLTEVLKSPVQLTGIELRPELVDWCNTLAQKSNFKDLNFISTDINDYQPERIDMLIALHACDIATDLAIAKGIQAKAEIIVVAPCCHKQIRRQMDCQTSLQPVLNHGILKERQAELITDGIRALLLAHKGYRTKVFEFIETEHTPKNVLIVGIKAKADLSALVSVQNIKRDFGIEYHYLEKLLGIV